MSSVDEGTAPGETEEDPLLLAVSSLGPVVQAWEMLCAQGS